MQGTARGQGLTVGDDEAGGGEERAELLFGGYIDDGHDGGVGGVWRMSSGELRLFCPLPHMSSAPRGHQHRSFEAAPPRCFVHEFEMEAVCFGLGLCFIWLGPRSMRFMLGYRHKPWIYI